jgi:uncharacterized membrane protein YphA (DoxX/SURF4 family)
MALVMANVLPWLEVLVGGLIIVGLWTHIATFAGMALLTVFSGAVAISLLRGKDHGCGCFQSLTPVQWQLVYRNILLMGLLPPIYTLSSGTWSLDNWLSIRSADSNLLFAGTLTLAWLVVLIAALLLQWLTRQKPAEEAGLQSQ